MAQTPNRPNGQSFAPTQQTLDRLSARLNQRFYDEKLRRLPRDLQEWEDRHSLRQALRSIKPGAVSVAKDISWVWLPVILLIYLSGIIVLLVKVLFLPLTLILLQIRRSKTRPTIDGLPKISLLLKDVSTLAELKSSVDAFVVSHGKVFREVSWGDLLKLAADTSGDLVDPGFNKDLRVAAINQKLSKCRLWIRDRRWRFIYPDLAAKADARRLNRSIRISRAFPSDSERLEREINEANSESARVQAENSALAAMAAYTNHQVDDARPPCFLLLEYHVSAHPAHSVSIYQSPSSSTITVTQYSPSQAISSSLFATPLDLAERYCETDDFKAGSFVRQPSAHQWAQFNKAIRELNLVVSESDIGENAPEKTSWTLFVHYGDRFIFSGDSTRGSIGNKVAAAVAQLISKS